MNQFGVNGLFIFFLSLPLVAILFCMVPYLLSRVFLDNVIKAVGMEGE